MKSSLNRIFKVIWSKVQMAWVAVSEVATAHGKQQSITRITRTVTTVAMLSGGAAIAAPPAVNQLPTGGQVAAGIAAIGTNGNTMTVTQTSDRAAINWNTFDIGSQAAVNFVQPGANAVALNRVNSPNPSQIYGQLSSNGQVYLINAAGVYFAPGAQVNVGGIVATTHQMSDAAFMAGSTTFDRNGSTGKVINEGTIQTSLNGYIAMLAPEVRNSGLLLAQAGTVAMAAGESITLNFGPTSKLDSITVTAAQLDTLVENRTAIKAPNGLVILSARAANQLAASVINSGTIEAKGVSQQGGRIVLEGSTVSNTGTLDVSSDTAKAGTILINGKNVSLSGNIIATSPSQAANTQGGTVKVLATETLNVANANILASGNQGGQIQLAANQLTVTETTINADGDTQGGSVHLSATSIQQSNPFHDPLNVPTLPATLAASGFTSIGSRSRRGQGGNVTLTGDNITLDGNTHINVSGAKGGGNALIGGDWQGSNGSYQATTVYMGANTSIDASATDTGNGGKVVLWSDITNANGWTNVYGSVYARGGANGGSGGQVETSGGILQFAGFRVDTQAADGGAGQWLLDPYNFFLDSTELGTIATNLNSSNITLSTVSSSTGGANADTFGMGHLVLRSDFNYSGSNNRTLTLNANSSIWVNGNMSATGSGALGLSFNANNSVFLDGNISSKGGSVSFSAATVNFQKESGDQSINTAGGSLTFGSSNISLAQQSGGGTVTFDTGAGALTLGSGTIAQTATRYSIADPVFMMGWGGRFGSGNANYNSSVKNHTDMPLVAGNEYTVRMYLWGNPSSTAQYDVQNSTGNFAYIRVLKDTTGSVSISTASSGTQYRINDSQTVDVAFIAQSNGTLQGYTTLTSGGWDPAFELYGLTRTGLSTTTVSGTRSLTLASSTGQITGSKNASDLASLTVNTGNTTSSLSGVISGTTNLFKLGAGTLTLSGTNTYTGTTNITAGTLIVSSSLSDSTVVNVSSGAAYNVSATDTIAAFAGLGTINLGSGSTLTAFGDNRTSTFDGVIAGSGSLAKAGTGELTLTANNSWTGAANITAGNLTVNGTGKLGGGSYSGALTVASGTNFNWRSTSTQTLSSIAGAGNFTANASSGTLTISGTQTFTGTYNFAQNVTVSGGGNAASSGLGTAAAININNGGNLSLGGGDNSFLGSSNSLTSTVVTVNSGGTLYAASGSHHLGRLNLAGGTTSGAAAANYYYIDQAVNVSASSTMNTTQLKLAANASFNVSSGNTLTINGVVQDGTNTNLLLLGGGNLVLAGVNTYTGSTTINGGSTLRVNGSGSLNSGSYAGAIVNNGSFIYNSSAAQTLSGNISGNGTLTQNGSGNLTLTGANNSYSGDTIINAGNLTIGGAGRLGNGSYAGNITNNGTLIFNSSANQTLSGVISGSGNVTENAGNLTLSGSNTYSGNTTITGGVLLVSSDSNLGAAPGSATAGKILINGGSLRATANFTLNTNRGISLGASNGTFVIDPSVSLNYAGVIAGTGNMTKSGTGTLVLSGDSTYSGSTNITAGTLQVGVGGTVGSVNASSNINISSGAIFALNRTDALTIGNAISGAGGVIISQANNVNITGAATYTGNTSVGGGALSFTNANAPTTANFTGSGTILIQPSGASFGAAQTVNYNVASAFTGFTIGSETNTANLAIGSSSTLNISGPISLYAGNITLSDNLVSSGAGSKILIKALGKITTGADSLTFQTNNGSLVFWSNANSTSGGGINLENNNLTFNTANGAINQATGGGDLIFGGGAGVDANGNPTGAAISSGTAISFNPVAGGNNITKMHTGGGNIRVNANSTGGVGLYFWQATLMNSGNGSISVIGQSATSRGIEFNAGGSATNGTSITGQGITLTGTSLSGGSVPGLAIGNNSAEIVSTGSGDITITGTANGSVGLNLTANKVNITSADGNISLVGSSAGTTGINYYYGNVQSTGNGSISLNGSSTAHAGIYQHSVVNYSTTTGNISIVASGAGSPDSALTIGGSNITTTTGSVLLQGVATGSSRAVYFTGTTNVTTAGGSITVNGTANTGSGIQTAYNLSMCVSQGAGAIAVTGSSTASGYGIGFQGTTTNLTTAVGDITLTGTSPGASASAIEYYGGNIVSSAGGNISINANSGRAGFYQPNVLNITATTGNISILANGGSNFHTIQMGGGNITTTTGDVRIEGNHSGAYKGVYFLTNPTNITTAGGDITINGTSSSDWATYFSSAANLFSQSGNISVSGISNSSGGFYSGASNFTATSGNITLFGNGSHASAGGYQASSSVISTTSGTVQITGIARGSYPGIYYSGTLGITTSNGGDIILNGTGGTGGQGIQFDGNVNLNASQGSGNISLTGTSTPTRGIHAIAALNIATSTGSIFLNGTSGAGYQGVRVEGASNISSTTGDITINGTASTGNGIQFDSASSTIRSTSGNIALNGVTGNGGAWGLYYLGSEISSAGNISLTSDGLMRVNANIYSYGAGNNLVIKSNGSIQNSAATQTIQTNNGTLVLWANANGSTTTGRVLFDDSVATLNTANGSTTQTSGGGDIIVGGGSVVDGDGNPIGAVSYNADWAVSFGGSSSGSGQIYSGGGDISIKGNTSSGIGVILGRNSTVNAGNGTINIEGCGTTTAVFLNTWNGGPYNITAKGDITLTGSTSGWNANVSHAYTGIRSFYDSQSQGGTIRSTGGNVTLTGTGQGEAVFIYSNNNIVADTGNVTITGTAVSGYRGIVMLGNVLAGGSNINISTTNNNKIWLSGTVGQLAGSAVATTNANITISGSQLFDGNAPTLNTQTGNITLRANTFSWTGTPTLGTNGSIAILPLSDSAGFGQGLYTSWFNLNPTINGATYTPNQLTIGNAYNTEALYWNSDNTVKGAISLYGGTVSLSANMTSSATGDIWIQGNNTGNTVIEATSNISKTGGALSNITFRANGRITLGNSLINATNNGGANVILWSDYGNSNTGGVSSAGSINTNGGHVWIGGSSTANGTLTWNGLTVGDGGSVGANGANWNAMDVAGNITTNGGDVLLWVGSAYSTGNSLNLAAAKSITAGSGNITLIAKAINSNALTVNTTGTFTWAPNSSTDWGSGATWNGTSASNIFTADANSTFANLKIANVSTLSNLVLGRYSGMTGGLGAYFINNQANLTFAGNTTISGNITAYGAAVSVGSGGVLATTASNTGNIALVSTVSSGNLGNITTNGSHVAFIGPQANLLGNITTNGGSIWAGDTSYSLLNAAGGFGYKVVNGGSSSTYYNAIANAVVYGNNRWNGQTVGSTGTVVWLGSSAIINSGSGDIMLWAKTPDNTNKAYLFGDATLRATTGNIAFIADKVEPWTNYTGNLTFSTNGTVNLASTSGNYGGTFTLGGAASGSDFVGAGTLANIKIANMFVANSSVAHPASLVIGRYTGTGLSGDTVYSFGNTGNITVNGTLQSVSASATPYTNIVLNAPNVNITGNLGSAGGVTINTAGNVTQTLGSSASLIYAFNGGNVNLSSTANALTNISAAGVGNLTIVDAYTGTADGLVLSGVNVTGKVDIQNTGSIKLASGNIRTTSTASSVASPAVRLAAGYNYAVGNTSSNVNITSGQTITMGTGALGMIYSGGVSDTDLGGLVTSGSGRFRYSSNVSSAGYNTMAAALTTGLYTLYREAPTLTVTANSSTIVYGNGSSLGMTNNALNGDTLTQILGSTPMLSASGNIATSGNWAVGNHTVTPSGSSANYLGYANVAYVNGTVQVTPATLTVTGTQVSDKVYNNSTVATFTNNGSLVGVLSNGTTSVSDVVTLTAAGEFSSKNVGANIAVTMNSTISGADAGNYVLTQPSSTTANITAKTVTLSASKTYDGNTDLTGDVTIVTGIAGETLTYTNATAFSSNVADNASNYIDAITLGNQSGANATQGGLASNYQLPSFSATGANNTVTLSAKDVTLSLGGVSKVYSGNTSYTANVSDLATLSALLGVSGDTVTGISLTYDNKNVGTGKTLLASAANISSGNSNYNITYTDTSDSIITRLSSVTWTGGTTGNWFDASNWAGGAVPDLSNVETVIIPTGIAATFGSATASAVNITGLQAAAATLYQTNGTLNVGSGGIALSNLTQAAGNITTTGDIATSILSGTGGNISLGAGTTLNVTQSTSSTYAGKIAGAGSLLKAGTGSLTLTGVSTFTGGTNITAGTLIAGNSNPSSSLADTGSVNVESGATYQLGGSETIGTLTGSGSVVLGSHTLTAYNGASSGTFGGVISGSGHFAVATNASATLTGNSTYTGETVLYGNATLTLGTGGTSGNVGGSSRVSFRDGSVLRFNRSDNLDFTADLNDQGGTQSLIKDGAGILTLSSTSSGNSFDGTITVNAGTLNVTGGVLGASNTVRIQNNDATVIYNTSATQNLSVLNGTGVFQKLGSGTLQLATSSGFTGETTVSGGVLDLRNSVIGGNITNNADVWFNSWVGSPTYSKIISGTGNVTIQSNADVTFTGTNTYTGTTTNYGSLRLGAGGTTGSVAAAGGIASTGNVYFNRSDNPTYAGVISGTGHVHFVKSATLTANSTFTGETVLMDNATLTLGAGGTSGNVGGSSRVSFRDGSVLRFNRSDNLNFTADLNDQGGTQSVIKDGAGILTLSSTSSGNSFDGTITVNAGTLNVTGGVLGASNTVRIQNNDATVIYNTSATQNLSVLNGTGVFQKLGSGTLQLATSSGFTGETTVSGGVLDLRNTAIGGNITNNADVWFNSWVGSPTYSKIISGTGNVTVHSNADVTLTGTNTYTGFTANYGTLRIGANGTAGSLASSGISGSGTLIFNRSDASTYAGVISGTLGVRKYGLGTLTFTGANTYSTATNVYEGTLQIGSGSTTGSVNATSNIVLSSGATVAFNRSDDVSFANNISGSGGKLIQLGSGNLTLTGLNSYTGVTNVSAGSIVFSHNTRPSTSGFTGTGNITITPAGSAFTSAFSTGSYTYASTLGGLTIGNASSSANANITVNAALSIAGSINLYGGNIAVNSALTNAGSSIIRLAAASSGNISQGASGNITTSGLALLGGNANLTNVNNSVSTLAAQSVANLSFVNAGDLIIGSVNPTGLDTTGAVNITVQSGNISLTEAITTTSSASNAIVLNAGAGTAAGTATGGDILVSGNGSVTVGSGGRATLFTGSIADSTGVTNLVGNGSGNFRYNSNASSTGYNSTAAGLGAGTYAIYREQPTLTVTANNVSSTYGTNPTMNVTSSASNGDTLAQIYGAGNEPTTSIDGNTSSTGYYVAGAHNISLSGAGATLLGYAAPTYVNGTLTVGQATLSVIGSLVADKVYDGTTTASVTNGTLSGSYSGNVTLVQAGNFSAKNVGSNLTVTFADSLTGLDAANYVLIQPSSTTANITARTVTLSAAKTYDGSTDLTGYVTIATGVSGETLTYTGATANSANVADNASNYISSITLGNQVGANSTSGGLAINYQMPALNVNNAPVTISTANLTIASNSTSTQYGLGTNVSAVGYTTTGLVNNETIGSVTLTSAGSAATSNAGSYNITASGAANGTFTASNYNISYANGTLTVTPANITVTANDQSRTYGGSNPTSGNVTLTTGNLYNGDSLGTASVASAANATSNVGNYTLTASAQTFSNGTASNYNISYVAGNLSVTQANLTITANSTSTQYGLGTTLSTTNFTAVGLQNGETVGNVTLASNGSAVTANAGSYNITASGAANGTFSASNYNISYANGTLTVTPANITVKVVNQSRTYGASNPTSGNVTLTSGTLYNGNLLGTAIVGSSATNTTAAGQTANLVTNRVNFTNGLASNYNINYVSGTLTITKAALTIRASNVSTQYGLGTTLGTAAFSAVGLKNGETVGNVTLASNGSAVTANAGSYNITASGAANGTFTASNYNISYANGTLTVTPANITVTANDQSRTYGGSNPTSGNVTVTSGQLYNSDTLGTASVASVANATSNVGNYTLTASAQTFSNGTASNYNISYVAGNLSVTQANLTITANSTSTQYGLGTTLGTTNFTAVGLQNSETIGSVTLTSAGTSNTSSVGNYSIAASGASGGNFSISNYNVTYSGGNLQVTRANLTIAANSTSTQYGLGTTLGTTNFTAVGLQNGETVGNVTLASNGSAVTANAGSYNITASGAANGTFSASNYDISYTNGTLTVTPADITVTVNDQSRTYGASNPTSGNVTLTTGALYNGDTLSTASVASSANATSNVGNYNLTASAQTFSNGAASNYNISYANGTLTVNPADAVVTANSANLTYNGSQQSVSGFTVTGLVNGETAAVLTNVTAGVNGTNAGTYTTTATGTAQNYNLSFVDGTLVIDKAALTVTGNTANVTYTGQTQSVTGYSVAGLQGADTVADLTSISASGASGINAGTYTNTVSVGTETNYVLTAVDGALNVAKVNLTVTANSANVTYNGSQQSVAGFTATGLVNGETIAVLTNVSAGTSGTNAGIYTNQATGNADNYNLNFVNGTLTIDKALATVTGNSSSVTYNGQSQSVSGYSITGLQGSDTAADLVSISASGASARNAGTYSNEVTLGTETNYALTGVNGTLAIAQKAITITGIAAADKTYDGTTAAVVSNASAAGWIAGDNVTVTATGAFADKNAGISKTVVLNSTYAGSDVGNYVITDQATATANIAKATLTAVGNKVYDGLITINGSQLAVSGVNGETFSAMGTGTMSTKNVQVAQNLSSVAGLSLTGVLGSDLANYEALAIADTSATVTALAITLVAPNATKVYDGTALRNTTTSDLTALSAQLVGGDSVSAAQIVYGNKDVGAAKRVTLNSVTIDDGNSGANYQVSYTDSYTGVITKAPLTVTVVNDAKFVSQSDTAGYAGVVYSGFVSGETDSVLTPGSVSRANSGVNGAGTYSGVLQASGWNATNYDITYQAGAYTIVPANTLLVRAAAATTNYGTAPTYTLTAEYLASNGTVINALGSSLNSYVSVIDGAGGSAMFNLNPVNASFSSSNNLQVGGYNLGATNLTVGGNNFSNLVVVGSLTVNPKVLNSNLGVQTISKVYDGSTSLTGVALNFDRNVAGVLGSDVVTLSGSGSYNNRNVGANKTVSISMGLSGSDAQNYALSTTNSNVTGEITQLSSVQYIGPSNGSWSNSRNWAGGALPDGNNVAQVIIPTAMTVVYDSDLVGVTGSQIVNNGNISFTSANPFNLTNNVSGVGSIFQIGSGMLTVSGDNAGMSGNIDIGSNALTLASLNALGLGSVVSNGGRLSLTGTLARLAIDGPVTLLTRVHTTGDQRYNGPVTFLSSGTPYDLTNSTAAVPNFNSTLGNISFLSTVSAGAGSKSTQRNLVVSAANGTVLFNDQVGQDVLASRLSDVATINFNDYNRSDTSPYSVDVAAQTIKLFGDVTSFETQQYRGAMLVGDNGSNGDTRLLLSMDPLVSITGSVDDVNAGQHTLMLRAITLGNDTPRVNVYADVGQTRVLNNIDIATGRQNQASGSRVADTSGVGNDVGEKNTSGTWKSKDQWLAEVARDRYSAARSTDSRGSDQHGKRFATLANAAQQAQLASSEGAIDAGEVVVGDIINLNCDPKADESCRAK